MADFGARGFRTDRPAARAVLEEHARNFLRGFNLAAARWAPPHEELHERIPDEERGFAYEGAGMFAGILDLFTLGRARAVRGLLAGPGDGYVHLINVGAGWLFTPARVNAVPRLPDGLMLRWLALDGSGFGQVYFGGHPALRRLAAARRGPRWESRLAGTGRALWFVESGHPDGIAETIGGLTAAAQPHVWAGVGLAVTYAGAAEDSALDRLATLAAPHYDHFAQGVLFGAAARRRSGIVPPHTHRAATRFLDIPVDEAARWCESTAADLHASTELDAYLQWKTRLRGLATERHRRIQER
jgi:enediyne biosynthesis protein E3